MMYAKEGINDNLRRAGVGPTLAGVLAGAGGGIAQVSVMGPCTYLVTGAVNNPGVPLTRRIAETYARGGLKAFYPGGTAIAFRQATNWASRQGFTEFVRHRMKVALRRPRRGLTKAQEVGAGVSAGQCVLNHPFEVARIEAQTLGNMGSRGWHGHGDGESCAWTASAGCSGHRPRVDRHLADAVMVTGAKLIKDELQKEWIAVPEVQVASPHEPKSTRSRRRTSRDDATATPRPSVRTHSDQTYSLL